MLKKVNEKSFLDFCEEYLPKRTSWGKPIPNEKILAYQNVNIINTLYIFYYRNNLQNVSQICQKTLNQFRFKLLKVLINLIFNYNIYSYQRYSELLW